MAMDRNDIDVVTLDIKLTAREFLSPTFYHIIQNGDTIGTVSESSPPNVTFRRDLIGPRLAACPNCAIWFDLTPSGTSEFQWNLLKSS